MHGLGNGDNVNWSWIFFWAINLKGKTFQRFEKVKPRLWNKFVTVSSVIIAGVTKYRTLSFFFAWEIWEWLMSVAITFWKKSASWKKTSVSTAECEKGCKQSRISHTSTAAWPFPVPTSHATSWQGVISWIKLKSSFGYLGLNFAYKLACFEKRSNGLKFSGSDIGVCFQ